MPPIIPEQPEAEQPRHRLFNKNFYRFFFSFIAVVASVLLVILAIGSNTEV